MERKSSFGSSDYNHYSVEKTDDDPQATNTLLTTLQAYGAGERWGKGKQVAQSLLMELRHVEKIIDGFFKTCRDVSKKFSSQAFLVGLHEKGYFKISPDFMVIKKKDEEEGRTLYLAKWLSGRVAKVVLAMTNGYRSHGSGTRTLKISGKLTGRTNPRGDMLNDAQWLLVSGKDSFVHCPEDHESSTLLGPAVHAYGCVSLLCMHGRRRTLLPKERLKSIFKHEPKVPSSMTFGPSQVKECPPDFYASVLPRQGKTDALSRFPAIFKEKADAWLFLSRRIPQDVLKHGEFCHAFLLKKASAFSDGLLLHDFDVVMHGHHMDFLNTTRFSRQGKYTLAQGYLGHSVLSSTAEFYPDVIGIVDLRSMAKWEGKIQDTPQRGHLDGYTKENGGFFPLRHFVGISCAFTYGPVVYAWPCVLGTIYVNLGVGGHFLFWLSTFGVRGNDPCKGKHKEHVLKVLYPGKDLCKDCPPDTMLRAPQDM